MSGNMPMVYWMMFFLIFSTMLFKVYDMMFAEKERKVELQEYNYTYDEIGLNNTAELQPSQFTNFLDVFNLFKHSGLPWWITLVIYVPLTMATLYLLLPTFK